MVVGGVGERADRRDQVPPSSPALQVGTGIATG
jgi:hypothetical protein